MNSHTLDRLLSEVQDSSSRSLTLAPAEGAEVVRARRVTDNDWRLTLEGTRSLAGQLEAVIEAAPDAARGTCRTVGRTGRRQVRLEIGCRGPQLLASLLDVVIDHQAKAHPHVRLVAMLQVDDLLRPRRIDLLMPSGATPQSRLMPGMLGLVPVPTL